MLVLYQIVHISTIAKAIFNLSLKLPVYLSLFQLCNGKSFCLYLFPYQKVIQNEEIFPNNVNVIKWLGHDLASHQPYQVDNTTAQQLYQIEPNQTQNQLFNIEPNQTQNQLFNIEPNQTQNQLFNIEPNQTQNQLFNIDPNLTPNQPLHPINQLSLIRRQFR